ncbi:hypothetical protein [Scrofimicrobium sp. R131]|uniref:DNA-binding protein n=1 Tax=Scrofimicrobium appendicitidis TaxID=3079930 RepID=A0AAU7V9L9_9ACTO
MFVLTADQRASRRGPDLVPGALAVLEDLPTVLPFERTIGDEIQGVLSDPAIALLAAARLSRANRWSIGLGVGPIESPLPPTSREGRGPAFIAAREAVERAKGLYPSVTVVGADTKQVHEARTVLSLLAGIWVKRTDPGWEAVDTMLRHGGSQAGAARSLGISEQAISQRLKTALWQLELDAQPLIVDLLDRANRASSDERTSP